MRTPLTGHSGCRVELISESNQIFIRKFSASIEYNDRLKLQCLKQQSLSYSNIKIPKILNTGMSEDNLFFFDMEYINGRTLSEYIRTIEISKLSKLSSDLLEIIPEQISFDPAAQEIFRTKIKNTYTQILSLIDNEQITINPKLIETAYSSLINYEWNTIQNSKCHGDFTLENIIVSNNTLYAIDMLDSFYDSWIIDIAKLLQDLELKWSYRFESITENLDVRLYCLRKNIIDHVLSLPSGKSILESIYHTLLLNILRIIPYTNDAKTLQFLSDKIQYLINKITLR